MKGTDGISGRIQHWLIGACLGVLASACAAGEPPSAVVERLHGALVEVMREAEALGFEGRRAAIEPVIISVFDLPYVARLLVRTRWSELEAEQRDRMRDAFSALTVATYAQRFDGYSGQRFVTTGEREVRGGRRLVSAELRSPEEPTVRLDYLLQERDAGWRIVNVIADGVSELALKKTEYASIIEGEGFDALVARLEEQVRDLEQGAST